MVNNISSLSSAALATGNSKNQNSPEKIKDAAQQFEALMIGQLLKITRESSSESGGWFGTGDDQAGQIAMDMAEQQLATTMAKQGGFGLTTTITRDLEQTQKPSTKPSKASTP
jgi:flagellar protein FlgJ